jgi:hypothetical protein
MRPTNTTLAIIAATTACTTALAGHTNNILITGYWPPTNNMLRQWSQNPAQNPDGWVGGNWEGRGYNIHSYFPEFPNGLGQGEGDFEVDYQDTSADWEQIVNELKPAAIITFSRANTTNGWELEGGNRQYATNEWSSDYTSPFKPGMDLPIMQALAPGTELFSSLPIDDIIANVGASGANVNPFSTPIDNGKFLSNYIGLHGNWYHEMNKAEDAEFRNYAAGHIHVGLGTNLDDAILATEVTLRTLTDYLDVVIPAPSAGALVMLGCAWGARRRRG